MRTELQHIENIEKYLNNEMSLSEKEAFQKEIQNDNVLFQQVEKLKLLQNSIIRNSIKADVLKYGGGSNFFTTWKGFGVISLIILVITSLFIYWYSQTDTISTTDKESNTEYQLEKENNNEEPINEEVFSDTLSEGEETAEKLQSNSNLYPVKLKDEKIDFTNEKHCGGLNTWVKPKIQTFLIDPKKGAELEGENGTLIIVPSNAFIDENGNIIETEIKFELVEALNVSDMIVYNLTTTNDGKLLETGGMIYIQPYSNDEKVNINSERPLYIEIPTDDYNPNMMAWEGNVNEKGDINWENPKPLERFLTTVDLNLLDFKPYGFQEAVESGLPFKSYKVASKKLVDSLYYSFGVKSQEFKEFITNNFDESYNTNFDEGINDLCYINPLSIKTVLNNEFSNTFIATKEFEQRVKVLHSVKQAQKLFDMYVNNLSENLSTIDSMVYSKMDTEDKIRFEHFLNENLTNVKNANIYQNQLSSFYNKKKKEYINEVNKNKQIYEKLKIDELNKYTNEIEKYKKTYTDLVIKSENLNTKLQATNNIKLPVQTNSVVNTRNNVVASQSVYSTIWFGTGWMNIDAYLKLLSDKDDKEVVFNLQNIDYENKNIKVYQYINTLKTVFPLNIEKNECRSKFPNQKSIGSNLMKNTYAIGIIRENENYQFAYKNFNPYEVNQIDLKWENINVNDLIFFLRKLDGQNSPLVNQLIEQEKIIKEQIAVKKQKEEVAEKIALYKGKLKEIELEQMKEDYFLCPLGKIVYSCENTSLDLFPELIIDNVLFWAEGAPSELTKWKTMILFKNEFKKHFYSKNKEQFSGEIMVNFNLNEEKGFINFKISGEELLNKDFVNLIYESLEKSSTYILENNLNDIYTGEKNNFLMYIYFSNSIDGCVENTLTIEKEQTDKANDKLKHKREFKSVNSSVDKK